MKHGTWEGVSAPQTGAEMLDYLVRRRVQMDQAELEWSLVAARFARTDEYEEQGFNSPIACLMASCHMRSGAVADRVCVGEELERLDQSAEAVATGEIGFPHLALMARTAVACGDKFDEAKLLRHARKESVVKFEHSCTHARHAADPEGAVDEEKHGVEARSLTFSTADDGVVLVKGILDKVGAGALRTALEPLAKRDGKDDHRDYPRRLADALVDLSMHALDNGVPSQRTHLQVTTSLETLLGLVGAPAAEMEFSLPISAKAVERLACDCSITRILLGSDSRVIDVGRTKRTVSGPARRALNARDCHCRWPGGCDRPPKWSAAHHLVHWSHGGSTDLDNLILLCVTGITGWCTKADGSSCAAITAACWPSRPPLNSSGSPAGRTKAPASASSARKRLRRHSPGSGRASSRADRRPIRPARAHDHIGRMQARQTVGRPAGALPGQHDSTDRMAWSTFKSPVQTVLRYAQKSKLA